mmetsp:Transcript_76683/g.211843  ORF Transcript_76683/g.211843 Transcript_76683/m.211843 type:complete len:272 (+) Transcript_76683:388-1203(+)
MLAPRALAMAMPVLPCLETAMQEMTFGKDVPMAARVKPRMVTEMPNSSWMMSQISTTKYEKIASQHIDMTKLSGYQQRLVGSFTSGIVAHKRNCTGKRSQSIHCRNAEGCPREPPGSGLATSCARSVACAPRRIAATHRLHASGLGASTSRRTTFARTSLPRCSTCNSKRADSELTGALHAITSRSGMTSQGFSLSDTSGSEADRVKLGAPSTRASRCGGAGGLASPRLARRSPSPDCESRWALGAPWCASGALTRPPWCQTPALPDSSCS